MALDPVINFGKVTVSTGYDESATNIELSAGDGANLPSVFSYNLVWWNATDYSDPTDDPNREIVRCTARSTDTLTITKAQEGTSASTKNATGKTYLMILAPTKKMIDDIDSHIDNVNNPHSVTYTQAGAIQDVIDVIKNTHVDWGSDAEQVSADDIPDGITYAIVTKTQENNWE